ncbi:hypothetical protein NP233_g2158 [Leucocoprinus birnbaumii]|uniref:N-end rule aminoacyl transferase C-terminal domain-containing protein n=1 Tax=Leucocoprinus birnbaumii TaxID=56174 RepID=A0AAD5YV65_9AGAR|nr:hypothetical protein NP233_g2158 [Leucocoprinus birnbaumii]
MASEHNVITIIEDELEQIKSLGEAVGRYPGTCGYCSAPGERSKQRSNHHIAGLDASRLTCECSCPLAIFSLRLDAFQFKPSKSQRKVVNRWNRYVLNGREGELMDVETRPRKVKSKGKEQAFNLIKAMHAAEATFASEEHPAHKFEIELEPASFTEEKYALFDKYQRDIHHDFKSTPRGFERFLSKNIPYSSPPPDHLPRKYGSYHQLYRLDGTLIAMAVLDILPYCVSSVYFIYDKAWEQFCFGKISALREISLAKEINEAGVPDMKYLYMGESPVVPPLPETELFAGFYIHSCQKMRYKGEYAPSYLLDPASLPLPSHSSLF